MTEAQYSTGMFCWQEIATRDTAAAKSFYTNIFKWEAKDVPMPGEGGVYTLLQKDGKDIAGLYQMAGPQFEGVPPHWAVYMWADDVDASAAKVMELGGAVVVDPMDVPGVGRMAVCKDPQGGHFSVFHGSDHPGAAHGAMTPGSFCWRELLTDNPDAAGKFYTDLFGWAAKASDPTKPAHYTEFLHGGQPVAGMMQLPPELGGQVPPHWGLYVAVEDCDAVVAGAKKLGATVLVPPTDIETVGRFSTLADPTGAALSVITLDRAG
jgi:hypothetical protein